MKPTDSVSIVLLSILLKTSTCNALISPFSLWLLSGMSAGARVEGELNSILLCVFAKLIKRKFEPCLNICTNLLCSLTSRCVRDCEGQRPCGGKKSIWQSGYQSVQSCCSTMSWKAYEACSFEIDGTTSTTTTSTIPGTGTTVTTTSTPSDTKW